MLCRVCKNVSMIPSWGMNEVHNDEKSGHHQTFASLWESISSGCYVCSRLWRSLKPENQLLVQSSALQHDLDDKSEDEADEFANIKAGFRTQAWLLDHPGSPQVYALVVAFTPECHERDISDWIKRFSIQKVEVEEPITFTKVNSNKTNSTDALRVAKGWIDNCRVHHPTCHTTAVDDWYPTRLLDCMLSQKIDDDCCLVATKDTNIREPYMTLSHCWGSASCPKLTTSNYAKMLETVPFSTLPQLYQDAVQVTRSLGVRYLWIDSLCIIQEGDALRDWSHEVKVMGQVYGNSLCTISAAYSPDSQHTMFTNRQPKSLDPEIAVLDVGGHVGSYWIWEHDWWEQEVTLALINTRAWVLQERYLSPRVLYFGERQLLWECREGSATEAHVNGTLKNHSVKGMTSPLHSWVDIVQAYSNSHLTVPSDKVAAFAGIVESFEKILGDECVVGLWRRHLGSDLLWFVNGNQRRKSDRIVREATRPIAYRAPSWSWMAIDGSITVSIACEYYDTPLLYEILDINLEYATDNKTGLIKSGWLRMRGALKQPTLVWRDQGWAFHLRQAPFDEYISEVIFDPPILGTAWENDPDSLYCLPAEAPSDDSAKHFSSLVLQVVDRTKGVFRRAGVAILVGDSIEDMFRDCSDIADDFPCEDVIDGQHVFTII